MEFLLVHLLLVLHGVDAIYAELALLAPFSILLAYCPLPIAFKALPVS
jgi:hypothetical protein